MVIAERSGSPCRMRAWPSILTKKVKAKKKIEMEVRFLFA